MKEDRLRVTVGTIRSKVSHKESKFCKVLLHMTHMTTFLQVHVTSTRGAQVYVVCWDTKMKMMSGYHEWWKAC